MCCASAADPKLFVWPGKGVYATYNRKPHIKDPKRPLCDKFGFVQYMSTVSRQLLLSTPALATAEL